MGNSTVRVKVPASTANLGPGFDTLGLALNLYTYIDFCKAETTSIQLYGDEIAELPKDKSNLVYQVAQQVFDRAGVKMPELNISMYSNIPLTRGLGSSASAIIGALAGANALLDKPMTDDELFQMATAIEKHPDNVGASLFGGLVIAFWDGEQAEHIRIKPDPRLQVLVAIPEFQLSTEKARHVLPEQFSKADAVYNVSHASVLTAALCTGQLDMIPKAMKDRLHQPYRASLIPGMDTILDEAVNYGALGAALSGAGPTILTFVDRGSNQKAKLERFLNDTLEQHNIPCRLLWLEPCLEGVQVMTTIDKPLSFLDNIKGEVRA